MGNLGIAFFFIFILNFGISWLNAWGVGKSWEESKDKGGFTHFVTWCAVIMSASGFTWCYLFVLASLAGSLHYHGHVLLPARYVQGMMELGYLVIIGPVIGSGIGITISSWRDFKREKSLLHGGVAAYNTYAQIHNTVEAIRVIPGIVGDLGNLFKSDDDEKDSLALMLMIALVLLAVFGGAMTTAAIVKRTARRQRAIINAELLQSRRMDGYAT